MRSRFDVIVVGGGPAGSAAALELANRGPGLARRTLLLDGQSFPREKLCGGGLVPESDRFLRHLGIDGGFASVPIRRVVFQYPGGRAVRSGRQLFRVVHRREFDEALVRKARSRGVEFRAGDPVRRLDREPDGIHVVTAGGASYRSRVLIGADGARSLVRRALVGAVSSDRFVALELLTRGHDGTGDECSDTAVFDFRAAASGLRGYVWDFPSLRSGERWMNRGICGAARSIATPLDDLFAADLASRGVACAPAEIQGAGASLYDPDRPQSAERVLLAGDAVGIDPIFGEGISVALGTGILAANAAVEALASGQFGFAGYAKRIARSAVGEALRSKRRIAELMYELAGIPGGMGALFETRAIAPRRLSNLQEVTP